MLRRRTKLGCVQEFTGLCVGLMAKATIMSVYCVFTTKKPRKMSRSSIMENAHKMPDVTLKQLAHPRLSIGGGTKKDCIFIHYHPLSQITTPFVCNL
ncbi:hypothetical protein GJAV_G00201880 [Gymnothorax javanicus]|nr:hypothetical protein GJAV_G00201880 [Gymnothorax javanicus]